MVVAIGLGGDIILHGFSSSLPTEVKLERDTNGRSSETRLSDLHKDKSSVGCFRFD